VGDLAIKFTLVLGNRENHMNLNPISDVDVLCYGDIVLMPDGYFAAYDALAQELVSEARQQDQQQVLEAD
jgi:hypothetical protein